MNSVVPVAPTPPEGAVPVPEESPEKKRQNYNRLVRTAKLSSLLLEKVDFQIRPEAIGISKSLLVRDLSAKTEVLSHGTEDDTCVANVVWTINMRFKKRVIVKCVASYIVSYEGTAGYAAETVDMFIDTVAKIATYAYFRGLYAHLDWSANLGSHPLPVLQFQAKV